MTRTLSFLPCRSRAVLSSGVILISFRNWTNFSLFVPIWSRYCWNVMPCANRSFVTMGPPFRLASDGGASVTGSPRLRLRLALRPRDVLRLARPRHRLASHGGAPAPRRPAARTTTSSTCLGRRGPSPATSCGSHHPVIDLPPTAGPQPPHRLRVRPPPHPIPERTNVD